MSVHRTSAALPLGLAAALMLSGCGQPKDEPTPTEAGNTSSAAEAREPEAEIPIGKVVDWEKEVDNPQADGWDTEVLAAVAKKQLMELGSLLAGDQPLSSEAIAGLVAEEIDIPFLVPPLETVFDDGMFRVERRDFQGAGKPIRGTAEFAAVLNTMGGGAQAGGAIRTEFKVVHVDKQRPKGFATEQRVSLAWRVDGAQLEQHAYWDIGWIPSPIEGDPPLIRRIDTLEFEQTRTELPEGRTLFSDCTESALGANPSYREQILHGLNHWHERMPHLSLLNSMSTPGLAVGDVNGDGLDDLYLCQDPRLPNRLYLQNSDGTLRDASAEWGVDWLEDSRSAVIVDLDNDGDSDLAVAILGHLVIASNRDNRRFQLERVVSVCYSTASIAAADYDGDGRLDLYVCGYAPDDSEAAAVPSAAGFGSQRFVYHDANNSVGNVLLRNEGDLQFADVTAAAGLDVNNRRWSFAAAWEDFDNDGDPDLYVANDFGRNNLYRNDGGRFTDVAAELRVEDSASGMSVSWGDYDRDGRMDLYVSNMFSAAGSRIIGDARFKPRIDGALRQRYRRFARGNTLLANLDPLGFADHSDRAGVTMGRWAWGSNFADLNNDGWEDLVVANGNITAEEDSGDL